jgi:hypothetical protein
MRCVDVLWPTGCFTSRMLMVLARLSLLEMLNSALLCHKSGKVW